MTPPRLARIPYAVRILRVMLLVGACLHLTGGHWGVLQCIAWTQMLVDYSAQDGFIEGTRKTFDGEHPCAMCRSIAEGKKSERPHDLPASAKSSLTLKEVTLSQIIRLKPPAAISTNQASLPEYRLEATLWSASPPSPPPRGGSMS